MSNSSEEIAQRFWSKVDVRGPNDCWPWLAGKDRYGYGAFRVGDKMVRSHQIILWLATGEIIRDGRVTRHTCPGGGTRDCCNPDHVVSGTNKENMADKVAAGRQNKGEKVPSSKLTEMGALIAYDLRGLFPQIMIGKVLGTGKSQIGRIHRGESWAWLTGAGNGN